MFFLNFSGSYNPYDGPNEHPEAELPLVAGKYLYVYGTMDEDGFYEGLARFDISDPKFEPDPTLSHDYAAVFI